MRQHFYELELDPQLSVLDEGEACLLASESLEAVLERHYAGQTEMAGAVQQLIQVQGGGWDKPLRALVLRLHHYTQTRANPSAWFESQLRRFASPEPVDWRQWLLEGIAEWRAQFQPVLEDEAAHNGKAAECLEILRNLPAEFSRKQAAEVLEQIQRAGEEWPRGKKGAWEPALKSFFAAAHFLVSVAATTGGGDPLADDWNWVRAQMTALLRLTQEFSEHFSAAKREQGVVDFQDLEQHALRLLWNFTADQATEIAQRWRQKIRFVFVDEYQDINAAQDKIIEALSRSGTEANRFLVGDAKQSIYRFRLADPSIFRGYARSWCGESGQTIPLVENFRSRAGILHFANSVFALLIRDEIGGVEYDDDARLQFGASTERGPLALAADPGPRAELLLRLGGNSSGARERDDEAAPPPDELGELEEAEKEARLVALRLMALRAQGHQVWDDKQKNFRAAEWRDMAVLLRAPASRAEGYAKEFERAGVPLVVERGGFYESIEVAGLLSLLQVLDNPLQDLPVIAVVRSPLVGLSLDELAGIRLALPRGHFWTALVIWYEDVVRGACSVKQQTDARETRNATRNTQHASETEAIRKVRVFLNRFSRWRKLARHDSLSRCLETVLAETHYDDWLRAQPRGAQRHANIERLLGLAEQFDQFQRQGLFRFLRFIEAQQEAETEPEVAHASEENAVRLMSIHQSKGLEFPVVVLAGLGKKFNDADLRAEIILDEKYGLCPQIKPPRIGRRFPSLPCWLARQRQKRELRGEELRLLYVAMTRARDTLILAGTVSARHFESRWRQPGRVTPQAILAANSYADWLGLWFAQNSAAADSAASEGELPNLRWAICDDATLAGPAAPAETPIKPSEPVVAFEAGVMQKLRDRLSWQYPFDGATHRAAKTSVSALRREAAEFLDEEAQPWIQPQVQSPGARVRGKQKMPAKLLASEIGTVHHRFLQYVTLESAGDAEALKRETVRLERERVLSPEAIAALDLKALAAFWQSALGCEIRACASHVRRELAFTARFTPAELTAITGEKPNSAIDGEFVVVQGVADLVVLLPGEIRLVDFKTDELKPAELAEKVRLYQPQLKLYALALSRIYARPVTECWLHFLALQKSARVGSSNCPFKKSSSRSSRGGL